MKIQRRRFLVRAVLVLASLGSALAISRRWRNTPRQATKGSDIARLEVLADTIVPADRDPGAVQAGVPSLLADELNKKPWKHRIYARGFGILDGMAQKQGAPSFAMLAAEQRIRILLALAVDRDPRHGDHRIFFATARIDVLRYFYASETGQQIVRYRPPLNGYPMDVDPSAGANKNPYERDVI